MRNRSTARRLTLVAAVALVIALLSGCMSVDQTTVLGHVNKDRATQHRRALGFSDELSVKAQAWSLHMARQGKLSHNVLTKGLKGCFKTLGENVGYGRTLAGVEKAFIDDLGIDPPVHRINIMDTRYNVLGTGVTYLDGYYWVVHDFGQTC